MSKHMMPAISVAALAAARPVAVKGSVRADAMNEDLLKQVSQQLDKLNGEIKQTAEDALKQSQKAGEVSAETKATADKLLAEQTALNKSVETIKASLEGLDSKLQEASQQIANGLGGGGADRPQTLGQSIAGNDKVKAFKNGSLNIEVANAITTGSTSGGGLIPQEEEREPVRLPRRRLRVRGLLTQGRTTQDSVRFRRQILRDDQTGAIAEGAPSTASDLGWEKVVEQVKKIGTHINISEETLSDAEMLQTEIDSELRYMLDLERENQIVAGDGNGDNFQGLIPSAAAFVAANGLPNATRIDRLRLAILQVTLEDYIPAEILLNPADWAAIEMQKDGQDRYIYGNPGLAIGPVLWGKDVVETTSVSQDEWLVGDLLMAATYYDRGVTEIRFTDSNDSDFIEDMITVKARDRAALAVKRGLAMTHGNFTFA